ncbi:MAG: hypothetical protein ACLU5F_05400, partial [Anaerovoracaceae bacterium]
METKDGFKLPGLSRQDNKRAVFAIYYLEMDEGSFDQSEPHLRGTVEYITVFCGMFQIEMGKRRLPLRKAKAYGSGEIR